jgi:hypothetical protein
MNPLCGMIDGLSKNGASVQFKRRLPDGSLADADESQLRILKSKAQIASAAVALKGADMNEKSHWGIEMKDYANELYAAGEIKGAMEKYTEALAASDLGPNGNVDTLVVPVLCNLAACCIRLEEWGKCARFCQQALEMRPRCFKANLRLGHCFLKLGEYKRSIEYLELALGICLDDNRSSFIDESNEALGVYCDISQETNRTPDDIQGIILNDLVAKKSELLIRSEPVSASMSEFGAVPNSIQVEVEKSALENTGTYNATESPNTSILEVEVADGSHSSDEVALMHAYSQSQSHSNDTKTILALLTKAKVGLKAQREAESRTKNAMRRAFGASINKDEANEANSSCSKYFQTIKSEYVTDIKRTLPVKTTKISQPTRNLRQSSNKQLSLGGVYNKLPLIIWVLVAVCFVIIISLIVIFILMPGTDDDSDRSSSVQYFL